MAKKKDNDKIPISWWIGGAILLFIFYLIMSAAMSSSNKDSNSAISNINATSANQNLDEINVDITKELETIYINGINLQREINSNKRVILKINGSDLLITVLKDTTIEELWINGTNIVVKLPVSEKPTVHQNGTNIKIEYN